MSWYDEMVAAGRSKSLTTGNVRCGVAAVHDVLGSPALETPVNCHSELMEDSLGNIEPVQLGVEQMCQAPVKADIFNRLYPLYVLSLNRTSCTNVIGALSVNASKTSKTDWKTTGEKWTFQLTSSGPSTPV